MCPTVEELRQASGYKNADASHDLTIGQIIRVFRKQERWARLNWALSYDEFLAKLDDVRKIRNEVAHFRPGPLTPEQRQQMDIFAGLVKSLVP